MPELKTSTSTHLQLRTSKQQKLNVDRENRTIKDVVVCQVGDIKDWRRWSINEDFLQDLVKFANDQKDGILSNFGHNWDNLGKRLGRMSNFRLSNNKVIADLAIFKSADKSPGNENLGEYVMSMVEEDDKAIMNSIVFKQEYFYQKDSAGKELKVWYWDEELGWVNDNPEIGSIYPKFEELKSVDVVDEGAATDSMFSTSEVMIQLHEITQHPEFNQMMEEAHYEFPELHDFFSKKTKPGFMTQMKQWLSGENNEIESLKTALSTKEQKISKMDTDNKELQESLDNATNELSTAQEQITQLQSDLESRDTTIEQLNQRITELEETTEEMSADTSGNESGGDNDIPLWKKHPMNQKFMAKQ